MTRTDKRPSWILSYRQRRYRCRKLREAEKQIKILKSRNQWIHASHLHRLIRRVWWGIKKYSKR